MPVRKSEERNLKKSNSDTCSCWTLKNEENQSNEIKTSFPWESDKRDYVYDRDGGGERMAMQMRKSYQKKEPARKVMRMQMRALVAEFEKTKIGVNRWTC